MPVRVELREVPADADLQTQVEHAIRASTGESIGWPELARSANGALPVILLDGFDELLQATGTSQSDYLRKVADFQRREADQGRPVVVCLTSRIVVADRARPVSGTVVVRLESFSDDQIAQWLEVWNSANSAAFARQGVRPLGVAAVHAHGDLAAQPLLLLMLALYDTQQNALQNDDSPLEGGELYERLLRGFAEREIVKTASALAPEQLAVAVERELEQLSLVAFAMFNRGRQWVAEAELDADLTALGGQSQARDGLRASLSAAQLMLGRFFFVHEAQATRDDERLRTYEFLHATFGEYLVARFVMTELSRLAEANRLNKGLSRPAPVDDAFFYALLSFSPLVVGSSIMNFIGERIGAMDGERRRGSREVMLGMFREALLARSDRRYGDYLPERVPVTRRPAVYSANLVSLAAIAAGQISGSDLFPDAADALPRHRPQRLRPLRQRASPLLPSSSNSDRRRQAADEGVLQSL